MIRQSKQKGIPDSYKHAGSKRVKIPTEADDKYMPDEERKPIMFYPEARSEDGMPRLSWRRNTDKKDVAREAHPLYIQEKVDPSWFVNHLIDQTDENQTHLFSFNGYPEDAKYNWYRHKGNWQNRLIHGDTSRVMASFLHREGMKGEVQMVYFDPPYGINFDHMFQVSTKKTKGGAPIDSKSKRAFRDTYRDGIHSYMDSIYRIATYSRMLLKDSGSFFLQIGSEHVHRMAIVLDEVFGAENRVVTIPFATTGGSSSKTLSDAATWLLWYAKDKHQLKFHQLYMPLTRKEQIEHMSSYAMIEMPDGKTRTLTKDEKENPDLLPKDARLFRRVDLTSQHESTTGRSEPFTWKGVRYNCPKDRQWGVSHDGLKRLGELNRLVSTSKGELMWKKYEDEVPGRKINNIWHSQMSPSDKHFIVETAEPVIERCILMATDPGDLVLDPTCGSGTTAFVAEKWGRRWITIDVNLVQISLCRQRMITAINDWYLTLDDDEGRREEAKLACREPPTICDDQDQRHDDPSSGFVYKRVPYVSSGTLAYDKKPDAILLVNQPLKKRGTKRISSSFTVESVSPHKHVSTHEYNIDQNGVVSTVLEAIGIAGIIMPGSSDRWHLEDVNTWPTGQILTHEARLRETGGKVAIVLVPDDNTAGVNLINRAAEEATGYPNVKKLFILAFEFEAAAYGQQTENRGRIQIHKIKINNDLALKELIHKKDDSSFVMLGEPDINVERQGKNKWAVQVMGYDTFDPATGSVSSDSADTVDCWMLDTNYDAQSFFARRIHLPDKQSDRQIKNLKSKLANRVNDKHWEAMLSIKSMPFETPKSGRIAVRIVTEHGEVMTTIHNVPEH